MKHLKLLIALIMTFTVLTAAFAQDQAWNRRPWQKYLGCYDTLRIDDADIIPGIVYTSRILEGESVLFTTVDNQPLQSLQILIMQHMLDTDALVATESSFLYTEGANFEVTDNEISLFFHGDVKDKIRNNIHHFESKMVFSFLNREKTLINIFVESNLRKVNYLLQRTDNCIR